MKFDPTTILNVLDRCCDTFTFPMLDNGYVYLAATRLSLFRSTEHWAMVIEVFGFSPRSGLPDTAIQTFASKLHNRNKPEDYVDRKAWENYLANNPSNESRFVFPVAEGEWQDSDNLELVAEGAAEISVRDQVHPVPPIEQYALRGIELEQPPRVQTFELCRFLAETMRQSVLATAEERRLSVLPEMTQILLLDEWHHPDLVSGEHASDSEAFRQLAQVLATGDPSLYRPSGSPNTHWRNWPDGGRL